MVTTVQIGENTKKKLDKLKVHHRETYDELFRRLVENCSNVDKESLTETIEILSDPAMMRDIAKALEDYEKGKGTTLEEFKKELRI